MASLLTSQLPCMILLLIGTLFFGILPVYVNNMFRCDCNSYTCQPACRARKGKIITSFLAFFGGGVLLGTTFLHLLPESREAFEDKAKLVNSSIISNSTGDDEEHESFSIPEFIVCCGFFAVYLFEEIIHYFLGHAHEPSEEKALRELSRSVSPQEGRYTPPDQPEGIFTSSDHEGIYTSSGQHEGIYTSSGQHEGIFTRSGEQENFTGSVENVGTHDRSGQHQTCGDSLASAESIANLLDKAGGHSRMPTTFSLSGLLTVAALSFHSVFEGFAIGLQKTDYGTWIIFAAIAVHKFVLAFVVGLEVLATGGKNAHVYSYMGVFACMSPLGMGIAMITQNNVEETNPMVVSVLNAISTGTLLYVTFFEILQRDGKKGIVSWLQLIATAAGFVVMALVQFGSTFA